MGLMKDPQETAVPFSAADAIPGVVSVPGWENFAWLRAGFSTRHGGGSMAYGDGELNLGWTAEDDPAIVASNRRRYLATIATGDPNDVSKIELAAVRQTHSATVCIVEEDHGPLVATDGKAILSGDGILTGVPGILLGVQTADCIPVLVADTRTRAVGAFHAGWRGTLARIVEQGVADMRSRYGSNPQDIIAAVGPGIGQCCYAVGEEVRSAFNGQFAYAADLFTTVISEPAPQIHIDLWEANRRQLLSAGVSAENISVIGECTGCTREGNGRRRYFSHRMEQGYTGRMMAVIGVTE